LHTGDGNSWDFDGIFTPKPKIIKQPTPPPPPLFTDNTISKDGSGGNIFDHSDVNPFKVSSGWKSDKVKQFDYTSILLMNKKEESTTSGISSKSLVVKSGGGGGGSLESLKKLQSPTTTLSELKMKEKEKKEKYFVKGNRVSDKRNNGIHFPGARKFSECETTRSGLITECKENDTADQSEMMLQCMLHTFDICKTQPALLGTTCKA
jgi:hypothetical protein